MYSWRKAALHRLLFARSILLFSPITGGLFTEGANLIIYSQILEISTLRSFRFLANGSFTALRASELIQYLDDRGYNLSFVKKEIQRVHAITRNETLKLSHTTQLRSVYHIQSCPSFHYQLSLLSSQDTTASFKPHLLLLSDEPTTLVTFLRTNKQINRHKESFRCDTFSDVIPFLPVGK